jgi:hypothetical protein
MLRLETREKSLFAMIVDTNGLRGVDLSNITTSSER